MKTLIAAFLLGQAPQEPYKHPPESERQEGIPQGKVTRFEWKSEKVYPGTIREWWTYVPAQVDGSTPAALMVFQDGHAYVDENMATS